MGASFVAEQRVLYGDTDAMGIAYYANYLKWFEIGRTELFRLVGSSYQEVEVRGCFLPVYEAYCRYLKPARYDDIIHIETRFSFEGKARMRFYYRLFHKQSGFLLAEGYTVHVCTDEEGRPLKPPVYLKEMLQQMERVQGGNSSS
ncbi:MAG: acyl-CoA thioesterase [Deltaproteobacteria bacterium]|nr:MAG: acyl-CoA thioesterase [Deltaproteobacteria bacterium]